LGALQLKKTTQTVEINMELQSDVTIAVHAGFLVMIYS